MNEKQGFFATLHQLRWDDHRYYHHSRINQSLHLVSASSFVCAYLLVWTQPAVAVFLAWIVGMTSRQAGHFFFEPRDYDDVNHATHDHKEDIKVGYNLFRKIVLMTLWAVSPVLLYFTPTVFGLLPAPQNTMGVASRYPSSAAAAGDFFSVIVSPTRASATALMDAAR